MSWAKRSQNDYIFIAKHQDKEGNNIIIELENGKPNIYFSDDEATYKKEHPPKNFQKKLDRY